MDNKGTKKSIMICDDEPDILKLYGLTFKPRYNVILVDSGEKCIEKYIYEINRGNKIDLVLLDYKLHDMMGDSVARMIKRYGETKIILISAYNINNKLVKELENNGHIIKYILKPIALGGLANLVDELLKDYL